jgi:hypothetical protein
MSADSRLDEVQAALKKRGVRDVKFCFFLSDEKPSSEVVTDAATFLQAYLEEGQHTAVEGIGDSPR